MCEPEPGLLDGLLFGQAVYTCDALAQCANGCFDDGCVQTCYAAASRDAQTNYMQFANCPQLLCDGFQGCPECSGYESRCLFESR